MATTPSHRFFGLIFVMVALAVRDVEAAREVILNFEELTIAPGTVFGLNGFARSDDGIVTNVAAYVGANKIAELRDYRSPESFNLFLSNSVPGDLPLVVKARDTAGNAFSSRAIPLHFPGQLTSRIAFPSNGATEFLNRDLVIRVEAAIDYGAILGVGVSWQSEEAYGYGYAGVAPYEVVFRPRLPGVYTLRSAALVQIMDGTTPSEPVTINVLPEGVPLITRQPFGHALRLGETLELSVESYSRGEQRYQWLLNGKAIPNATNAIYRIANVQKKDDGFYCVQIDNFAGRVASDLVDVSVSAGGGLFLFSNKTGKIDAPISSPGQIPPQPPYIVAALWAGPAINRMQMAGYVKADTNGYFDGGVIALNNIEPGEKAFVQVIAKDEIPFLFESGLYGQSKRLELVAGETEGRPLRGLEGFTLMKYGGFLSRFTNEYIGQVRIGNTISLEVSTWADSRTTNLFYQWNKNGASLAGETNALLKIAHAQRADAAYYSVIVDDGMRVREIGKSVSVDDRSLLEISLTGELTVRGGLNGSDVYLLQTSKDLRSWADWIRLSSQTNDFQLVLPQLGENGFYRVVVE